MPDKSETPSRPILSFGDQSFSDAYIAAHPKPVSKSFDEALKILGIEEYRDRIVHSNSHGELMHLWDYIVLADQYRDATKAFQLLFSWVVKFAEENWQRPESCFQHMPHLIQAMSEQMCKAMKEMMKDEAP